MKRLLILILVSTPFIYLSGCIYVGGDGWHDNWESQQRENRQHINDLELSEKRSAVEMRLGTPDFTDAFARDDDVYRVLYYRTHRKHSDGDTSRDETTPLIFKNDVLVGWGHGELRNVMN